MLPEPLHLDLVLEDETVVDVIPSIGYIHRGLEKLCEIKDYNQMVYVIERICGICSFGHGWGASAAIEGAKAVSTQTATYGYGGYHRTDLDNPVTVPEGQKYAIEVEITTPSGQHEIQISRAYNEKGVGRSGDNGYTKGVVNEDESILFTGKEYVDWTSVLELLKNQDGGIYDYDNFAIKAYANPTTIKPPTVAKGKITKLKAKKKAMTVYWKKLSGVSGYQVGYKRTKASKYKIKNVSSSRTSIKISKLKKKKYYRFKVRGYVKYNGKTIYGKWSATKKKKTK